MASPTLETFCCILELPLNQTEGLECLKFGEHHISYNVVSIVISVIGMFGAIYQILPRTSNNHLRPPSTNSVRQRSIICWLAISDLMAAIGILIRSASWMMQHHPYSDGGGVFCAVASAWIQYFYTVTYFWNICYAIDVFRVLRQEDGFRLLYYHVLCWIFPALLCLIGLSTMYYPDMKCYHSIAHILPNYLCTFIPLVIVMIANPVLYCISTRSVRVQLTRNLAMYTHRERSIVSAISEKFFLIVLVFYICWLPNVVNSILIWTFWTYILNYKDVLFVIWYIMAVVNPLQAVLNCLVYRGQDDKVNIKEAWDWLLSSLPYRRHSTVCTAGPSMNSTCDSDNESAEITPFVRERRIPSSPVSERTSINGRFYNSFG